MAEQRWTWLVGDVPGTDDPEVVRAYIRDLQTIPDEERTPDIEGLIESAERLVLELERERAQTAA